MINSSGTLPGMNRAVLIMMVLAVMGLTMAGCTRRLNDPAWATQPYPDELHTTNIADMQVFRKGTNLHIVNSTAHSYSEFDLWVNQRYVHHIGSLGAGQTVRVSLWDFKDEFGDRFYAGGFFRVREAQVVRLVQIQQDETQPLLGLVTIRAEDVIVKPEQGR